MKNKMKKFCAMLLACVMIITLVPGDMVQASSTANCNYSGYVACSWVRDTTKGHSPLSFGELFTNTYTLEVDYLTYSTAFTVLVSKTKFNNIKSLCETVGTTAAASAVCAAAGKLLGYSVSGVTGAAVSVVVGFGYAILAQLDTSAYNKACDGLKNYQMVKVTYMTGSGKLCKGYSKYTSSKYTIKADGYNTYLLNNPYSGKYGTWRAGNYGYLYKL